MAPSQKIFGRGLSRETSGNLPTFLVNRTSLQTACHASSILIEWGLSYTDIEMYFGMPDSDVLASKLNHKVQEYVSWSVDPGASYAEAFLLLTGRSLPMDTLFRHSV